MPRSSKKQSTEENLDHDNDDLLCVEIKQPEQILSKIPSYLVEISKSGRAECRKCDEKIANKSLRVGVLIEGDWGLFTRWQHLQCTIFDKSLETVEKIEGIGELSPTDRELVEKRFNESKNEVDYDFQPLNPDDLVRKCWETPAEPSSDLLMPLLPYQKEGLGWMLNQESNEHKGGILADEMGMGKTIQAISLILSNRPDKNNLQQMKTWGISDDAHGFGDNSLPKGGTLIVLPTVAIRQWQTEIARFTRDGALKVKVYHGNDRSTNVEDLVEYDVILTSYKVLEMEYRKATAGTKVVCRICGKKFYPEKLRVHRKYFCGEFAQRTEAQSKTEKKLPRAGSSLRDLEDIDEDQSSEDEISKQKKAHKVAAGKGITKTPSKKRKLPSEDQSEDEIAKQKAANKKKVPPSESTSKKAKTKAKELPEESSPPLQKLSSKNSVKKNVVTTPKSKKVSVSEDSEDEISKTPITNSGSKRSARKSSESAKRKITSTVSELNSDEEEYSDGSDFQVNSSDIEDDSSDDEVQEKEEKDGKRVNNRNSSVKSKTTKSTPHKSIKSEATPKSSSKKGAFSTKTRSEEDEEEHLYFEDADQQDDSALIDEEVERDIQAAIRAHEKELKKAGGASQSSMHLVSWFRIILDEAHLIKDRSTSTAKAVFNLVSLNKWCLTGTPLQNRVGELYSLIRFLRIDPHAYYFCRNKGCNCKSLHYRFTKSMCDDCGHSVIQHFCHFNKHILNPIQRSGYIGDGKRAMLKLKQQILDEILLRRTKITRAEDIQLPMRIVKVRQEKLDDKEDDFYQALYTQSQAQFNTYLTSGTVLNNYAHIFDILIRLRQAVDHPYLVIYSESQSQNNQLQFSSSSKSGAVSECSGDCGLCHDPIEDGVNATCGHSFCRLCIMDYVETMNEQGNDSGDNRIVCPDCNQPLSLLLDNQFQQNESSVWDEKKRRRKSILDKIELSKFQTSTKMEALMQELYMMDQKDCGAKAIVFSQFVNMLDLLDYRIQRGGIGCVKLMGSMNLEQRDNTIKMFKEDPNIKVLLISLKAGGVALNLTVASHIFLMDPWWNPAAEMQAIDRTHRIGQFKPIFATRFIIEDTIEERILKLQEKKKLVFDGTVGGDVGSMAKLTVDDMRFLFH